MPDVALVLLDLPSGQEKFLLDILGAVLTPSKSVLFDEFPHQHLGNRAHVV
ncbi:MAG: hypothetical protein IT427_06995 [Pirellulales bacterium]|nr:hypothetical protein [Pirellulales bacterium]